MLWLGFILALVWPNADGHALARVTVLFTSCKECSARAAGISLRGAESNAPIIPDVIERRRDRLVLSVKPGYYRVSTWIASPTKIVKVNAFSRFFQIMTDDSTCPCGAS